MNVLATGALPLYLARTALGDALAPAGDDDPDVLPDLVDALSPPVLMLEWNDPWLEPRTVAGRGGFYDAQLNVLCVAARVEPGPGVATLEGLVAYVLARLELDARSWPVVSMTGPRVFTMAGVPYLGARIFLRVPVSIETEG